MAGRKTPQASILADMHQRQDSKSTAFLVAVCKLVSLGLVLEGCKTGQYPGKTALVWLQSTARDAIGLSMGREELPKKVCLANCPSRVSKFTSERVEWASQTKKVSSSVCLACDGKRRDGDRVYDARCKHCKWSEENARHWKEGTHCQVTLASRPSSFPFGDQPQTQPDPTGWVGLFPPPPGNALVRAVSGPGHPDAQLSASEPQRRGLSVFQTEQTYRTEDSSC